MAERRSSTIGIFYAWWRGDPLDRLPPLPGLDIFATDAIGELRGIDGLDEAEAAALLRDGHRLYVARRGDVVGAHGWCATREAAIGELGVEMRLSSTERYLWGFETQPDSRGQGIYTHMLQEILAGEAAVERFWIGHDIGNEASARGILRAGFAPVGEVYQRLDGALRYVGSGAEERARAASALLGIAIDEG